MNQILKMTGVKEISKKTQKSVTGGARGCNPADSCCYATYTRDGRVIWVHDEHRCY